MSIIWESLAFLEGEMIPARYTCDGENVSPPLRWNELPEGTQSLALIVDDPDAPMGTFVHWVIFNIPPSPANLPENIPPHGRLPNGAMQGTTSFRRIGYGGPCPPSGTHRYYFKLWALDTKLNLNEGITKQEILAAMQGHILGESQLMGKYRRR
ncbi:YbhB/YbcL family Raf kinase inhibitor-like protein [Candidatus Latescibacterota bacterium]